MTIRKGGNIIAGNSKAVGSGWEIGDIGITALGIDETKNKRRYLNGQVISQTQFAEFATKIKNAITLYPALGATEVNWQAEVTNSVLGQCGKFVIDDVAGTIRLPKVVNINGLQDLTGLGGIKAESLPNISGDTTYQANYNKTPPSPFVNSAVTRANTLVTSTYGNVYSLEFNASLSSSTYQDNAPVQQEAVQYPYFIQVAEGVETSVDVSREIELNNPFSLLDYKYSEYELSNASWLLSNGQWNSGTVYQSVYDLLLQIYNGTTTKAGVSVKLSTETYADTDFVLNTSDTTFRLPLLNGEEALPSDTFTSFNQSALTTTGYTFTAPCNCYVTFTGYQTNVTTGLIVLVNGTLRWFSGLATVNQTFRPTCNLLVKKGDSVQFLSEYGTITIGTPATDFGYYKAVGNGSLYFYVGDTIQNANIIAAGQALTDIANLKAHYVTETYKNGNSGYRIWSDGWCEQWGKVLATGSYGQVDVVLLKEMQLPYVVSSNIDWANVSGWYTGTATVTQNGATDIAATPSDKTSTGFKLQKCSEHSWYVCGYMA